MLLYLDDAADFFDLLLDILRFLLVHGLLDRLRGFLDELLRLDEAEARDRADDLDDLDLVRADFLERRA